MRRGCAAVGGGSLISADAGGCRVLEREYIVMIAHLDRIRNSYLRFSPLLLPSLRTGLRQVVPPARECATDWARGGRPVRRLRIPH